MLIYDSKNIFLADDDEDDRDFFQQGLKEVCDPCILTTAENGEVLMNLLSRKVSGLPDIIFLDLNMPAKNGFECLEEIKKDQNLKNLPVIIFSTTAQEGAISQTYNLGANYYVVKPTDFKALKKIITRVLTMDWNKNNAQPSKERFLLSVA